MRSEGEITALDWFWLNLTDDLIGDLAPEKILKIHELKEQAKAMEKEKITMAFRVGMTRSEDFFIPFWDSEECEIYYEETFGNKETK